MLEVTETKEHLLIMLADAGVDQSAPSILDVWQVFKSFSYLPVNCLDDFLLFELGTFNLTGRDLFYLTFVRLFKLADEDGEYDHMQQVSCEFTYKPDEKLKGMNIILRSYECESLDDFFSKVDEFGEFHVLAAKYNPRGLVVELEDL